MVDVWLIIIAIVVPVVLTAINIVILAKFIHPQDVSDWLSKVVVVRMLCVLHSYSCAAHCTPTHSRPCTLAYATMNDPFSLPVSGTIVCRGCNLNATIGCGKGGWSGAAVWHC